MDEYKAVAVNLSAETVEEWMQERKRLISEIIQLESSLLEVDRKLKGVRMVTGKSPYDRAY